jgi:hypothetical protein
MNTEKIRIGMKLIHRDKGEITVLGIAPHCGDYCITIDNGWVYLSNCLRPKINFFKQAIITMKQILQIKKTIPLK